MQTAIANQLFNIIPPDKKDLDKQTYEHFSKNSTPSGPHKVIKLNNKTPLECKMAIDYYKYERNKGMGFTIKEAFSALFLMCCKPKSVREKDKIFKESEERLMQKLSKQFNVLKNTLLGKKALMLKYSQKHSIYFNKLAALKKKISTFQRDETS